jgi:chromosome segregation ATPase
LIQSKYKPEESHQVLQDLLSQTAQEEIHSLTAQLETLRQLYRAAQTGTQKYKEENAQLKNALEAQIKEPLTASEEENRLLAKQHELLKARLLSLQKELQQIKEASRKFNEHARQEELTRFELVQKLESLEPELQDMKQAHQESLNRIREGEATRYQLEQKIEHLEANLKQEASAKLLLEEAKKQLSGMKRLHEELQGQAAREKLKIEKLANAIQEKDRRIADLQQIETSLKKTSEIKQELELALEKADNERQQLQMEKDKADEKLQENRQHIEQLERVIKFLRERSQEAQLELNQLREEYQTAQRSIKIFNEQLNEVQQENLKLTEQLREGENTKKESVQEIKNLQIQFVHVKNQTLLIKNQLEQQQAALTIIIEERDVLRFEKADLQISLDEKMQAIASFEKETALIKQTLIRGLREAKELENSYNETVKEKVTIATKFQQVQNQMERFREQSAAKDQEIIALQNRVNLHKQNFEEQEGMVRQAQQYLTKKVKELAVFENKYENQGRLLEEMQEISSQNTVKIVELQTKLDLQIQQQHRLEELLQEAAKSADEQQKKWEDKYFTAYEKWQNADGRIKEFEKEEDKYKHLQGLLSNLGAFLGTTPGNSTPSPASTAEEKPSEPSKTTVEKPYQNLFNMPAPPKKHKQSLLD